MPKNISSHDTCRLAYVSLDDVKVDAICDNFKKSLDGQNYVKCEKHRLRLISYTMCMKYCECRRNEYLRCSEFSCRVSYEKYVLEISIPTQSHLFHLQMMMIIQILIDILTHI